MNTEGWHESSPFDGRIEPPVLSDMLIEEAPAAETVLTAGSPRYLTAALLISLLIHVTVLAIAAWVTNQPEQAWQAETIARPSIQIRIQQPVPPPAAVETLPDIAEAPRRDPELPVPEVDAPQPATASSPDTATSPLPGVDNNDPSAPEPSPQRMQLPTVTDLRNATRRVLESERDNNYACTPQQRRNELLDCGPETDDSRDDSLDYAAAELNTTYSFFNPPAAATQDPDDTLATSNRTRASIDLMDAQLGTTQTKKRILNLP